jgi:8-oxo-dGTP pyrophosphatase MutT (NUDIX family)
MRLAPAIMPTPHFSPQHVPAVADERHLPALSPRCWTAQALRERFTRPGPWTPRWAGDLRSPAGGPLAASASSPSADTPAAPPGGLRPAAVLIPLVLGPLSEQGQAAKTVGWAGGEAGVLLTRRTEHLEAHPGQISFPGGRVDPQDANATATALREAWEEVGLNAADVEVLAELPPYITGTGYVVTPVLGLLGVMPPLHLAADEVAEAFVVPLSFLMNPRHHRRHQLTHEGRTREFLSMPWRPPATPEREYFIWGATAAMLSNLYGFLRD